MNQLNVAIVDPKLTFSGSLTRRSSTTILVLHHAAANSLSVQQVHTLHRNQGWAGVGYNFYITKDGAIYRGRGWEYVGAHTTDYNSRSIGICFEGNYETTSSIPNSQIRSGMLMVAESLYRYPSITTVTGHKSLNATACPGKYFPLDTIISGGRAVKAADASGNSIETVLQSYLPGGGAPPGGCPYAEPSSSLSRGQTGDGVRWVQWSLNKHNAQLIVDGDFGALTDSAVRIFQRHNTLDVDGIVGPATRAQLKSSAAVSLCPYAEPAVNIRRGSTGQGVSWVQWHLVRHGHSLSVDGDFGPLTENAVRSFQRNNGLDADGIVGPLSKAKLK